MSSYTDDAYRILGVSQSATDKEIKTAYRKLALEHHPDRQTDPKKRDAASNHFAAIANAYEILTDEHLRAEYDETRRNSFYPNSSSSTTNNSNGRNKTSQNSKDNKQPPFRYHFSDPYEVFKRDFREQFGIEYPGAKYDWVDFDTPLVYTGNNAGGIKMIGNGASENRKMKAMQDQGSATPDTKKKGFNPFRRKPKSIADTTATNDRQLIVANPKQGCDMTTYDPNSTAIVLAEKRNNRPISMDVQTSKEGTVTTTRTTITRPDGSTETMVMKTGIPGKAPQKGTPVPRLSNGPTPKALTSATHGQKMLPPSTTKSTTPPTNRLLAIDVSKSSNCKSGQPKLLGWGGKP
jgi:curved DNA-binding protein CbpA